MGCIGALSLSLRAHAQQLEIVSPFQLYYNFDRIVKNYEVSAMA